MLFTDMPVIPEKEIRFYLIDFFFKFKHLILFAAFQTQFNQK